MFDFDDAKANEFELLPCERMDFTVSKGVWKTTSTGGEMLSLTFDVIGDSNAGRKVFMNYNFVNANPKAVNIAKGQYLSLVSGAFDMTKESLKGASKESLISNVLDKQLSAMVAIKKGNGDFSDSNTLKNFEPYVELAGGVSTEIPF